MRLLVDTVKEQCGIGAGERWAVRLTAGGVDGAILDKSGQELATVRALGEWQRRTVALAAMPQVLHALARLVNAERVGYLLDVMQGAGMFDQAREALAVAGFRFADDRPAPDLAAELDHLEDAANPRA